MTRTTFVSGAVVACFASLLAAGCTTAPTEGYYHCSATTPCPSSFPVCRVDQLCYLTGDATPDASADGSIDAARIDAAHVDTGVPVDMGVPPGDGGGGDGGFDTGSPGIDAASVDTGTPGVDAATGTDAASLPDVGTDAASPGTDAGSDAGGPCGGGPLMTFYRDADVDGHGNASVTMMRCAAGGGYVASSDDCDDTNPARYPGAPELCNGVDDNCDGTIDGAAAAAACVVSHGVGVCTVGACSIASCSAPYGDCDATYSTGCETDTSTAATSCGFCGNACLAATTCATSSCVDSSVVQVEVSRSAGLGEAFGCVRRANGRVACWGSTHQGELGDGATGTRAGPVTVLSIDDAVDIAATQGVGCAVRASGQVWCWGVPSPRLGRSATGLAAAPGAVVGIADATSIESYGNGSYGAFCVVRMSGQVACWGDRFWRPDTGIADMATPVAATGVVDAVGLSTQMQSYYGASVCAIRSAGSLICWANTVPAARFGTLPAATEALGSVHAGCARTGAGGFSCAPDSGPAIVGYPNPSTALTGVIAQLDSIAFSGSGDTGVICARMSDGTIQCWGVGVGSAPSAVSGIANAIDVSLGIPYTAFAGCAVTSTGRVLCWGDNSSNWMHDPAALTTEAAPFQIPGL